MAGIKITALPAASASALTDIIPAVQTGITKKETLQQVLTLFDANVQLASSAQVTGLDSQLASYIPLAGGTMTGALILNTSSPTTGLQAASKAYVDQFAAGITVILAAYAATTANLNATQAGAGVGATLTNAGAMAAFSVDGVSPPINSRILVKNQTLTQHNGVYVLTTVGSGAVNWVLTRATDYDQSAEIVPGTLVAVNNGTAGANTSWLETATVVTVDTNPILFSQFTFAPSSFLMVANNLSDVANAATSRTNLGLGTAATKAASDNGESVVASVTGSFTPGNVAIFDDANGTIGDTGLPVGLVIPSPRITTGIFDVNGNEILGLTPDAASLNFLLLGNSGTTLPLTLTASGTDANIPIKLISKGTAGVQNKGTGTNDNAPAGYIGEVISSTVLVPVNIPASTNVINVTSISLTAGDWDVYGSENFAISTTCSSVTFGINSISATIPAIRGLIGHSAAGTLLSGVGGATPTVRVSIAAPTTYYLIASATFSAGTVGALGNIYARRAR